MFKNLISSVLALSVFVATLPTPALAAGEFAQISQEPGEQIYPIIEAIGYVPPTPSQDELAYFAYVDEQGRLFDVDVNLTHKTATVATPLGAFPAAPLTDAQASALGGVARTAASSPGARIQCAPVTCLAIAGLVVAVIGAVYAYLGWSATERATEYSCRTTYDNGSAAFTNNMAACYAKARAPGFYPRWTTTDAGSLDMCRAPTGYCSAPSC